MTVSDDTRTSTVDAVVIGAGFSGLYMLHKLRDRMGLTVFPLPPQLLVEGEAIDVAVGIRPSTGIAPYRAKCDEIVANDYEGFAFDTGRQGALA
jgi:NADH dehydrogenase FAD-containing subunit